MNPDDADLLAMMKDAGTDLSRTREVGHFVLFDGEQEARGAAAAVPSDHETEVYESEGWVLHAWHQAVLGEEYLLSARPFWESLARQYGGEYDGWDADADAGTSPSPPSGGG